MQILLSQFRRSRLELYFRIAQRAEEKQKYEYSLHKKLRISIFLSNTRETSGVKRSRLITLSQFLKCFFLNLTHAFTRNTNAFSNLLQGQAFFLLVQSKAQIQNFSFVVTQLFHCIS